jgi:hypothetical protein
METARILALYLDKFDNYLGQTVIGPSWHELNFGIWRSGSDIVMPAAARVGGAVTPISGLR